MKFTCRISQQTGSREKTGLFSHHLWDQESNSKRSDFLKCLKKIEENDLEDIVFMLNKTYNDIEGKVKKNLVLKSTYFFSTRNKLNWNKEVSKVGFTTKRKNIN